MNGNVLLRLQSLGSRSFCFRVHPSRLGIFQSVFFYSPEFFPARSFYSQSRGAKLTSCPALLRGCTRGIKGSSNQNKNGGREGKGDSSGDKKSKKEEGNKEEGKENGEDKEEKPGRFSWFSRRKKPKVKKKPKNLYEVLGVPKEAKHEEIKARYLSLAKQHHPDTGKGDPEKFTDISAAWSVLGNKIQRETYDARLELLPDSTDPEHQDLSQEQEEFMVRVIVSTGVLKVGPMILEVPPRYLIILARLGIPQVDGDKPEYKSYNPLRLWWTLLALLGLRLLYLTYQEWQWPFKGDDGHSPRSEQDRATFFWRLVGLALFCSFFLLRLRKMDILSLRVEFPEEFQHQVSDPRRRQMLDLLNRLLPRNLFVLWVFIMFTGPILSAPYNFLLRSDPSMSIAGIMPSLEWNCSKAAQVFGTCGGAAFAGARAHAVGTTFDKLGRQMLFGALIGRGLAWLYSFLLVGRHRRKQMRSRLTEKQNPTDEPAAPAAATSTTSAIASAAATTPSTEEKLRELEGEVKKLRSQMQERAKPEKS